ncbi:hydantoinase B/oxoprolinase family protein [Halorarius halobius]|uniref:hydantoinase B/oxoprolinase family protein n=1 Tax=Halorarius halobius TaxID=2962671 RepID=UPI0020CE28B0|nr:hydantoinase B/oxoprolinase family protein [Halorarius halobius]
MTDPVTLSVVENAAAAVCEEMNATLVRTARSPNIKERRDCSCALFDPEGRMVAQAENIPVHLGAMPFSVEAALDRFPADSLAPGDAVLLNDPYHGGAHLPDLTLVEPVFHDGDLVALVANRAHHADVGGATAGSVAADSTDLYQEGLRIPPVKIRESGAPNEAVRDVLFANVRTPDERRGDLRAQAAANEVGARRFRELVDDRGNESLADALDELRAYSERRMRAEIDDLPDGSYRFEDYLDDDGRGNADLPIVVTVTVDGDDLAVDFADTADQTAGPLNAPPAVTASATYFAVRAVTDPDIPPNAGAYAPIDLSLPGGSLVDPDPPAPVVGGNLETSQRVTDAVLGAFARAVPERAAAAGQGTMNNVTFGGTDPRDGTDVNGGGTPAGGDGNGGGTPARGDGNGGGTPARGDGNGGGTPFTFYETQGGGFGGRAGADGMDGVQVHMTNTLNTPVEVLETAYPLRVRAYALRPDTGGDGEFRGGLGLRRDIEVRTDCTCSVLADRQRYAPYGIEGGEDGATGETRVNGDRVPGKSTHELDAGDVVSLRTPGGGGYGDSAARDSAARERDLRLGKVTEAAGADDDAED